MNEETMDTGFEDFMSAFNGDTDYQTDAPEETGTETENQETEVPASEEESEEAAPDEAQEPAEAESKEQDEPSDKPEEKAAEETFTLKINKQERTVSREEVISLAQKGADYDRVKDNFAAQTAALEEIAKDAGTDIPGLMRSLRLNMLKKQGLSEDAANERMRREDLERENARLKQAQTEKESNSDRARRDVEEFRKFYPKVELSKELIDKLTGDVQKGMTLLDAYRKYETAQKDEKIAQLERQLAAEKQNKANRAASPGSQKDSGGKRSKSDFDEFMEAFA